MLYHYFSLDNYFKGTKKYFAFIDGLFKTTSSTKKEVLDELKIPDSTYRTNRLKEKARYNWSYLPVIEYFGYKNVEPFEQKRYELLLAKIYHNAYYKDLRALDKLSKELETLIDENTYLKPIFVLFRVFINCICINKYSDQQENTKEDMAYLENFRKVYFTDELSFLFQMLRFYFGKSVNNTEMENYAISNPKLLWIYYMTKGTYYYLNGKDNDALTYYELLLDVFLKDFNIERFSIYSANVAFIYNYHGKYSLSLERSSKMISYAIATENASEHNKYAIKHFIFSLYMLDKFDEINEVFETISDISFLGDIYIVLEMIARKTNHIVYSHSIKERIKQSDNLQDIDYMITSKRINREKLAKYYDQIQYWSKIVEKLQVDIKKF